MIFHDRVMTQTGGGRNADGDSVPLRDVGPFPANVTPIRSTETVTRAGVLVVALYRLHIGHNGGSVLTSTGTVKWRGMKFTVQGDVEPWIVNGRLHHYEATLKKG